MILDGYGTLLAATLTLLLGRVLVHRVAVLRTYSIPEPVVGGLLVTLVLLAVFQLTGEKVQFETRLSPPLMLAFFACIGLNADLASLRKGGRPLLLLLSAVLGLLCMQNALGIAIAWLLGENPLLGLVAGSITLSGGHGTGAAWSAVFSERFGLASVTELAMACATFGLVLGGLIGGPVARFLVKRVALPASLSDGVAPKGFEQPDKLRLITAMTLIETLTLIAVCLLVGQWGANHLRGSVLELPAFVCVLFTGVVLRNGLTALGGYSVFERAVSVVGNVSLSLFLAIALMSLRLWELTALALPMMVLLLCQAAMMVGYAVFVTFRVMGRSYDAAVIAAGHCGFGLGATPTAIANMQAVTDRFGPSHVAFLVVPMVGAFFIDIANALIIKLFLALPFMPT